MANRCRPDLILSRLPLTERQRNEQQEAEKAAAAKAKVDAEERQQRTMDQVRARGMRGFALPFPTASLPAAQDRMLVMLHHMRWARFADSDDPVRFDDVPWMPVLSRSSKSGRPFMSTC